MTSTSPALTSPRRVQTVHFDRLQRLQRGRVMLELRLDDAVRVGRLVDVRPRLREFGVEVVHRRVRRPELAVLGLFSREPGLDLADLTAIAAWISCGTASRIAIRARSCPGPPRVRAWLYSPLSCVASYAR